MTRFVVDCETLLSIAAGEIEVATEHHGHLDEAGDRSCFGAPFDEDLVGVAPDLRVHVSPRLLD